MVLQLIAITNVLDTREIVLEGQLNTKRARAHLLQGEVNDFNDHLALIMATMNFLETQLEQVQNDLKETKESEDMLRLRLMS